MAVLSGIRILDFTKAYSGPYCTMLLSDMGAEVIKIERRDRGDDTRTLYPVKDDKSGYFAYLNRGKKSVSLDLKSTEGLSVALNIAKHCDILVENFAPGTMEKLGLNYSKIRDINPDIVYASLSGFGQNGPYRSKPAYDGVVSTMAGMVSLTGFPDAPVRPGPAIGDSATGAHCAIGILAAFIHKLMTGKGQYVDVAMFDTVFSMLEGFVPMATMLGTIPERFGNGNASSAPYNMYQTKDGRYVAISTANDGQFARLARLMDNPELIENPHFSRNILRKQHDKDIDKIIGEWTMHYEADELVSMLDDAKVPAGKMLTVFELLKDPQIRTREMLISQEIPGLGTFEFPGNPIKFSETPNQLGARAPELGEHSDDILLSCGYSPSVIQDLHKNQVI